MIVNYVATHIPSEFQGYIYTTKATLMVMLLVGAYILGNWYEDYIGTTLRTFRWSRPIPYLESTADIRTG